MIYTDEFLRVEFEESEIAWVKIFTNNETKEISQLCEKTRARLFRAALVCEKAMIEFYKPEKVNWASFANYCPRVHIHIQARFKDDSFFPESMWGVKQREGAKRELKKPEFSRFLSERLSAEFGEK